MSSIYYTRREQNLCVTCGLEAPEKNRVHCLACQLRYKTNRRLRKITRAVPILPVVPAKMASVRTRDVYLVGSLKRGAIDPPEKLDPAIEITISDFWTNQDSMRKRFRPCKIPGIIYRKVAT